MLKKNNGGASMAKDLDEQNGTPPGAEEYSFSLEEILAEYAAETHKEADEDALPIPMAPPCGETAEVTPAPERTPEEDAPQPPPAEDPEGPPAAEEELPPGEPEADPAGEAGDPEESPLLEGLRRLREAEADYTGQMFAQEEPDPAQLRAETLIPGADVEDTQTFEKRRERKPRPEPEPAPDLPPGELARLYGKGLASTRLRGLAVFLTASLLLLVSAVPPAGHLPIPFPLFTLPLQIYLSAGLLAAAMLLGADVLGRGLLSLAEGRPGMESLTALACIATLADSLTMLALGGRDGALPYCGAAALGLGFVLWGTYLKRRGLWLACRTAVAAAEPYLVTLDEKKWNGRDAYAKASAPLHGFGTQIQSEDGAQRIFRVAAPLLLLACLLFSLISSLGTRRPEHLLWCLSATLTACASYSGLLCFGMPMLSLSARLAKSGAALAGWEGVRRSERGNGILLTDNDLFPPGAVSLNGIKIFGDFSVEKVVAVTATLIRAEDSGLDKVFHDLLRTQGATYRRANDFCCYEGGGASAEVRGEQILVGTAAFMKLMEVPLPQGLGVKNAVFCAIDGELAGIFALNYTLQSAIPPALSALIHNQIRPVLATRDFNVIPAMLHQRFKLPVDKMEFPTVPRRIELSDPRQEHSTLITAVLCREGLVPFSEAVVGARRLRYATRLSAGLAAAGSGAGALLSFYLTFIAAYTSLSPANLTVFLLLWTVPTVLISGWVNRY